jgi:hypothetical protein
MSTQAWADGDTDLYNRLEKFKQSRMPGSAAASSAVPKLPFRTALHDLMTAKTEENTPLGVFCFHKHCHGHVPFGIHGHQAAMKANLCVKCYDLKSSTEKLPRHPFCVPAKLNDACCKACVGFCNKCGQLWDFSLNRCTRHDAEQGCDAPKSPNRAEAHSRIAEYEDKMKKLIKAEQVESEQHQILLQRVYAWTDEGDRAARSTGQSATGQSGRTRESSGRKSGHSDRSRKRRRRSRSTDKYGRELR